MDLSPNGRNLAWAGSAHGIWVWDLVKGEKEKDLSAWTAMGNEQINAVAFSADGKALFSSTTCPGSDGSNLNVWSMATRRRWGSFVTRDSPVVALAASPDRVTLATVHEDGIV